MKSENFLKNTIETKKLQNQGVEQEKLEAKIRKIGLFKEVEREHKERKRE